MFTLPANYKDLSIVVLCANNKARKESMRNRLKVLGIPDGNITFFDNSGAKATDGHEKIIEMLKAEDREYALILEDDACFLKNFAALWNDIVNDHIVQKNEWDLLYLGGNILNKQRLASNHIIECSPISVYCNHAYIIPCRSYDMILDSIRSMKSTYIIDDIYTRIPGIKILLTYPMMVTQWPPDTLLEDMSFIHDVMTQSYTYKVIT
jgi:GR25 family glycosyltransferase involved in LPS biosynthesis